MKRQIVILFALIFSLNGFSQQLDKDGRAILSQVTIKDFANMIVSQMSYGPNPDLFKAVMVNTMTIDASRKGGYLDRSDALIALQGVSKSKSNRDLVINAIRSHAGSMGTRRLLISWGLSPQSAKEIEFYANNGMGAVSRNDIAKRKKIDDQIAAKQKRIDYQLIFKEKLDNELRNQKLLEEEKQLKIQKEKIRTLTSKVYDLQVIDTKEYNTFRSELIKSIVATISRHNTGTSQIINSVYRYSYSDSEGIVGNGLGKFILIKGEPINDLNYVRPFPPRYYIEDIQVPIKCQIEDILLNYELGSTNIKISDKGIKYQKNKPTPNIQSLISSKMNNRRGNYNIRYVYGVVGGDSAKVIYERPIN